MIAGIATQTFCLLFEQQACLETDKEKLRKSTSDAPSFNGRAQLKAV